MWNPLIHGRQSIHTERSVNAFRKVRFQENLKRTSHMRSADMVPQLQVVFASRKIFRFVRWATQRVSVVFDIGAFVQHDRMRSYRLRQSIRPPLKPILPPARIRPYKHTGARRRPRMRPYERTAVLPLQKFRNQKFAWMGGYNILGL